MKKSTPEFLKKKTALLIEVFDLLQEKLTALELDIAQEFANVDIILELKKCGSVLRSVKFEVDQLYQRKLSNFSTPQLVFKLESSHLEERVNEIENQLNDISLGLDAFANDTPEIYSSYKIHTIAYSIIEDSISKIDGFMTCLIRNNANADSLFQECRLAKTKFYKALEKVTKERNKIFQIMDLKDSYFRNNALKKLDDEIGLLAISVQKHCQDIENRAQSPQALISLSN